MQRDFLCNRSKQNWSQKKLHYQRVMELLFIIKYMYYILLILSIKALPLASSS